MELSRGLLPSGRSSSLRPNCKLSQSRDGHGRQPERGEGRRGVGVSGHTSWLSPPRNWDKPGSQPLAPKALPRKEKNVARVELEKCKGQELKTKSCEPRHRGQVALESGHPRPLALEIPAMNQLGDYMVPLCPGPGKEARSSGNCHPEQCAGLQSGGPDQADDGIGPLSSLGDLRRPREDVHRALPSSSLKQLEQPKALRVSKNTVLGQDPLPQTQGKPWRGTQPPGRPAQLVEKAPIGKMPQRKGPAEPSAETWRKPRTALGMQMLQSVQVFHALGKRNEKTAVRVPIPPPGPKMPGRRAAAAEDQQAGREALPLRPLLSPSMEFGQPQGPGAPNHSGGPMDQGRLKQPWRTSGQRLHEPQVEPENAAGSQKAKRKRSDAEPSPQVCKKPRSFLGPKPLASGQLIEPASHKGDKKTGSRQGPQLARHIQEQVEIPAEDQGLTQPLPRPGPQPQLQSLAQPQPLAHSHTQTQRQRPPPSLAGPGPQFQPPCQAPCHHEALRFQLLAGVAISKPISEEQRPEREAMKRQAQLERENAAQYTALGKRDFFAQRQKDMEMANFYGYMI